MTEKKELFNSRMLREGLQRTIKLGLHPTRRVILKLLKKHGELSSVQIIEHMGVKKEDRYNLYHHLDILTKNNLITKNYIKDNAKTIYYKLFTIDRPLVMAFSYDKEEMDENNKSIETILDIISEIENQDIKNRTKIRSIELNITYDYNQKEKK